ncbi:MAG: response regulator transcription factor [Rubripirellula sp.]
MTNPTVFLVDDDPNDVAIIKRVCGSVGLAIEAFGSPSALMKVVTPDVQGCVVVDLMMPEMTGLQVHEELQRTHALLPIIVLTGHADAKTCREAFQKGVFDFVEKSTNHHDLLVVIRKAIASNINQHLLHQQRSRFLQDLTALSPREREVMELLSGGKTQKEIAERLEISVQTASKHRSKVFDKLSVSNEVDLLKRIHSIDSDSSTEACNAA